MQLQYSINGKKKKEETKSLKDNPDMREGKRKEKQQISFPSLNTHSIPLHYPFTHTDCISKIFITFLFTLISMVFENFC